MHYKIEQTATAVILWEGEAKSKRAALDAMARDAGYRDYASVIDDLGIDDGIVVVESEPSHEAEEQT